MSVSKKIARSLALPLALTLRLDKYFLRKTKQSCCIVNFHGVRKLNNDVFNNRHMPVNDFEKVLKYLKKNYTIVPLSRIFEAHRNKEKMPEKTIALTFDDGYQNNFELALPLLKKYNIPATYYIITKGLVQDHFLGWPDVIDIFKKYHKEPVSVNGHTFAPPAFYNEDLKMDLLNYLKTCGDQTEALVAELMSKHPYHLAEIKKSPELLLLVSDLDFSRYSREPLIEYGSHTHTHFNLEYLKADVAEQELKLSKEILESRIGKKVFSLAFPDGSYSKETIAIAKKLGYENIVAVNYHFNENNSDPNLLSRFTISNSTTYQSNALRLAREFDKYAFN